MRWVSRDRGARYLPWLLWALARPAIIELERELRDRSRLGDEGEHRSFGSVRFVSTVTGRPSALLKIIFNSWGHTKRHLTF
jgi:hypothetical protein